MIVSFYRKIIGIENLQNTNYWIYIRKNRVPVFQPIQYQHHRNIDKNATCTIYYMLL